MSFGTGKSNKPESGPIDNGLPKKARVKREKGAAPKSIDGVKIVEPVAQPIVAEPDCWYGATWCGVKEIILTNHNGEYFYIHGDEFPRSCKSPLLVLIKKFGKRVVDK